MDMRGARLFDPLLRFTQLTRHVPCGGHRGCSQKRGGISCVIVQATLVAINRHAFAWTFFVR